MNGTLDLLVLLLASGDDVWEAKKLMRQVYNQAMNCAFSRQWGWFIVIVVDVVVIVVITAPISCIGRIKALIANDVQ